jgi:hypothetical protein
VKGNDRRVVGNGSGSGIEVYRGVLYAYRAFQLFLNPVLTVYTGNAAYTDCLGCHKALQMIFTFTKRIFLFVEPKIIIPL